VSGRRAVSVQLIREAILRLHHGWEDRPAAARRRWWWTLLVGFVAVLALSAALVWGVRALEESGSLHWEADSVRWIATAPPISFSARMWLEGFGNGLVLWPLILFAAGVAAWNGHPFTSIAILLGYTLAHLPVGLGWWLWDRPRPDIILGGAASPGGAFRSFPSGHTMQAGFAYGILIWLWVRRSGSTLERVSAVLLYLLIVAAVALGRLRVGSHWPSDIVAGFLLALAWLSAVAVALHRARSAHRDVNGEPTPDAHAG
jgi:undecaprenyl-diphosphatase